MARLLRLLVLSFALSAFAIPATTAFADIAPSEPPEEEDDCNAAAVPGAGWALAAGGLGVAAVVGRRRRRREAGERDQA